MNVKTDLAVGYAHQAYSVALAEFRLNRKADRALSKLLGVLTFPGGTEMELEINRVLRENSGDPNQEEG